MLKRLRQWWERRLAIERFGCAFWCPKCGDELHFHADRKDVLGVVFCDCNCGHESRWYFGAPVPILLSEDSPS